MKDDLEFLVNETLKHHDENYAFNSPFPDSSGLLYTIQLKGGSFTINTLVTENIAEDLELFSQLPHSFSQFKGVEKDCLHYFETNLKTANYIEEQVNHRRFFEREDLYSNLSAPSDYWWLVQNDNVFEIFFSNQKSESSIKLGPLGEPSLATEMFNNAYYSFLNFFRIEDFAVYEKAIKFKLDINNDVHQEFLALFNLGQMGDELCELMKLPGHDLLSKRVFSYLEKVAGLRRFWLQLKTSEN